jgi:hypothetical protein
MGPNTASVKAGCIAASSLLCWASVQSVANAQPEGSATQESNPAKEGFWSRFEDPLDGKFDVTAGGEGGGTAGFVPIAIPGNDTTFGPSLLVAMAYFHAGDESTPAPPGTPPTMTFGGVGATQNDSWGAAGGHFAVRNAGRFRYLALVGAASANLSYYGLGSGGRTREDPLDFNIEGSLLIQQAAFRLGNSNFFLGGRFQYLTSDTAFDVSPNEAIALGATDDAGLAAFIDYDTRDNTFTPNRGTSATIAASYFSDKLGGDFSYNKVDVKGLQYWQLLDERLTLGLRTEYHYAADGAPFYSLPWVSLRGIPVLRYLGNHSFTTEIEPRYRLNDRWSLLGFAGVGRAATDFEDLPDAERAFNYGAGFRYLLARKLGLGAGFDLARGPEDTTIYLTFGNAWGL